MIKRLSDKNFRRSIGEESKALFDCYLSAEVAVAKYVDIIKELNESKTSCVKSILCFLRALTRVSLFSVKQKLISLKIKIRR